MTGNLESVLLLIIESHFHQSIDAFSEFTEICDENVQLLPERIKQGDLLCSKLMSYYSTTEQKITERILNYIRSNHP